MPFQVGNKLGKKSRAGGRKGYEFETKQLKRMSKILNSMLTLTEKMIKGKATPHEQSRYENLMKISLKIMDKLHPNRQFIEADITGELPFIIKIVKDETKPDKGKDS